MAGSRDGGFTGGFTYQPSLGGWLILLGAGAAIGVVPGFILGRPWLGAIIGALLIWRIALYLDWRKWKDRQDQEEITFEIDVANVAELDQITAKLRNQGVRTTGREATEQGESRFYLTALVKDRAAIEEEIGWA